MQLVLHKGWGWVEYNNTIPYKHGQLQLEGLIPYFPDPGI